MNASIHKSQLDRDDDLMPLQKIKEEILSLVRTQIRIRQQVIQCMGKSLVVDQEISELRRFISGT